MGEEESNMAMFGSSIKEDWEIEHKYDDHGSMSMGSSIKEDIETSSCMSLMAVLYALQTATVFL